MYLVVSNPIDTKQTYWRLFVEWLYILLIGPKPPVLLLVLTVGLLFHYLNWQHMKTCPWTIQRNPSENGCFLFVHDCIPHFWIVVVLYFPSSSVLINIWHQAGSTESIPSQFILHSTSCLEQWAHFIMNCSYQEVNVSV